MKLTAWHKTISGKLTLIYAAMFVVILIFLNIAAYLGLRLYIINSAEADLSKTLSFVANRIYKGQDPYESQIIEDVTRSEQDIFFRLLSAEGNILIQHRLFNYMEVDIPIQREYGQIRAQNRFFIYGNELLIINGRFQGYIQGLREVTSEYIFLSWLQRVMVVTSILGIIGALITGYYVTRKTLKPINVINRTARSISSSDLGKRLEIEGPKDELTELSATFNSMLDRLEESFKEQKQFVSDASHELRTPISIIQGYADMLERWGKHDKEVRDEALSAIQSETKNMKSLVERLLFLARGDNEQVELNKEKFRGDDLVEEVVREARLISDKIEIEAKPLEKVEFLANRELIKQMLRVFVDNSIKYTPEGGRVRVGVEAVRDNTKKINEKEGQLLKYIKITVEDNGLGIDENELPHIFDRFYIADKARSEKGAGLGLAIAQSIVEQHQGEIDVESKKGEGTKVSVFFP